MATLPITPGIPVAALVGASAWCAACCGGQPEAQPGPPPEGYALAYAMEDCAPWDGAATTVILSADPLVPGAPLGSEVPRPHVWLSVYQPRLEVLGERFEIDQDRIAGAMRCPEEGRCEPASGGWVRFREDGDGRDLVGDFELIFEDATTLAGGFDATWHERQVVCG